MKKFFSFFIVIFSVLYSVFYFSPTAVFAYEQTEGICYSQCLAYKFIWRGDYCYDLFTNQCSISQGDAAIKTVMILKDVVQSVITGQPELFLDINDIFTAWLVCKPLIENCLTPRMKSCEDACKSEPLYYAPDFAVGNYRDNPSIYYDKKGKELKFRVINVGDAYAWDIDVTASYGWTKGTKGVDNEITNFQTLFE
jgi:hypothetical protein